MKTLVIILILISFLQATILPLELVAIILICRSYIKADRVNLYLAFAFGLLISHLTLTSLGLNSLIYLFLIQITRILSKTRLAGNLLLIVPLAAILLSVNELLSLFLIQKAFFLSPNILLESLLSLPILYAVRLWEERFIIRKEIKLKI